MVPFRYVAEAARAAVMLLSHAHDHADFFLERVAAPLRSHHYDDPEAFLAIVREQEARRKEGNVVGISAAQRLLGRINPPGREKTS
jgi:hypothetical protein